ncbi:MAG: hypothetical protein P8Y80_17900, partial [Acidobacteriota bacterium]
EENRMPGSMDAPPVNEEEWEIDGTEENRLPGSMDAPPVNEEEWEIYVPADNKIEELGKPNE